MAAWCNCKTCQSIDSRVSHWYRASFLCNHQLSAKKNNAVANNNVTIFVSKILSFKPNLFISNLAFFAINFIPYVSITVNLSFSFFSDTATDKILLLFFTSTYFYAVLIWNGIFQAQTITHSDYDRVYLQDFPFLQGFLVVQSVQVDPKNKTA